MNLNTILSLIAPAAEAAKQPEAAKKMLEESAGFFNSLKSLSFDDAISKISNGLVSFGFKLMIAILVFYAGKFIIRKLYKVTANIMSARQMDASLITFILSLLKILLYFILIITVIGILGIETSSFLALFASAGVAIGLALSGTLQNFAGGVLILLLKPYKVGDYIEAQGYTGTVKAIQIFNTIINTVDNKSIIIPNGGLSTSSINNYSLESYRRVDWTIGLSYGTDFDKARDKILQILLSDDRVVTKYIEDDRMRRIQNHLELDDEEKKEIREENEAVLRRKKSFMSRLRSAISKHKKQKIAETAMEPRVDSPVISSQKIDRAPFVGLGELAESSINLNVRVWTHSSNYWPLFFEMNERFYKELPLAGFSFPFPQLDVHLNPEG